MNHTPSDSWHVVVSYDIVNDRRRNKVRKELKNYGEHIQYSVFECLLRPKDLDQMAKKLAALIDEDEDSVRIYQLCEGCRGRARVLGTGQVTEDPDVLVV
jgi:CRISPR-associated protein Cas2